MTPFNDFMVVDRAMMVATAAHAAVGQKRKYTGEPYINHPAAVVQLCREAVVQSPQMLAAAWLHDVVEDTHITVQQIDAWFGGPVGSMVDALTNCEASLGNRRKRFEINMARLTTSDRLVKTIKVCDLIDNTSTIVQNDPGFAPLYLREKQELLKDALVGADEVLWARAWRICHDELARLSA